MPNRAVTTLQFPCPVCDGVCEQAVDEDGAPVGSVVLVDCAGSTACENAYVNGQHADPLQAAWDVFCDQAQENRYQDGPPDTSSSYIQALRDSGRYR